MSGKTVSTYVLWISQFPKEAENQILLFCTGYETALYLIHRKNLKESIVEFIYQFGLDLPKSINMFLASFIHSYTHTKQ